MDKFKRNFLQKMGWLHFGRFFSQTHLVALPAKPERNIAPTRFAQLWTNSYWLLALFTAYLSSIKKIFYVQINEA
jgi:hypothetical protein